VEVLKIGSPFPASLCAQDSSEEDLYEEYGDVDFAILAMMQDRGKIYVEQRENVGAAGGVSAEGVGRPNIPDSVTVGFAGGLGNQIFAYGLYRLLQEKLGKDRAFLRQVGSGYRAPQNQRRFQLEHFNTKLNFSANRKRNAITLNAPRCCYEPDDLIEKLFPRSGHYEISNCWWWTNDGIMCLTKIVDALRDEFEPKDPLGAANDAMLKRILDADNSVAVHIRRGDFTSIDRYKKYVADAEYYVELEKTVADRIANPTFFIFSNDMKWARENIKFKSPCVFVDINGEADGWKDFVLMKNCKHNVIAQQSSFSTFAAILGRNPDKIAFGIDVLRGKYDDIFWKKYVRLNADGTVASQ
jgi:hypothetical protein